MTDFPHAEAWWWVHSKREISDDWIVSNLTEIKNGAIKVDKPTEILLAQEE